MLPTETGDCCPPGCVSSPSMCYINPRMVCQINVWRAGGDGGRSADRRSQSGGRADGLTDGLGRISCLSHSFDFD